MKISKVLLKMLGKYGVKHVFGFPGETTLPWYKEWHNFPEIKHILARDERSAAFMADAYSRISFKPGICESPGVGATHLPPGVAEAFKASVPMIIFTSDIPLKYQGRNMLTAFDQTSLFKGITKETISVLDESEVPNIIRRAFRLATTNKPGPVHVKIPKNIFEKEITNPSIYAQKEFRKYPGHRPVAEMEKVKKAIELLEQSERPVIICGQGVLYSRAHKQVTKLAELLGIPVGTTITGKGSIAENHPLSIGVIGSRGGTSFSNKIVEEADLIFYIGSNTDSACTSKWTLPPLENDKIIIHLDINETELGNSYRTNLGLLGDAKATLEGIINVIKKNKRKEFHQLPRIRKIKAQLNDYEKQIKELMNSNQEPVHPMRFIKELSYTIPQEHIIIADPGISAIYTSAFYKLRKPGRNVIFNYSLGALGYAIPAAVGAHYARPSNCVVALTGDGSFGLNSGELETISRVGKNINVILFNNGCFGWIKAALKFSHNSKDFATEFKDVNYVKIAQGFGLKTYTVGRPEELRSTLKQALPQSEPAFVEIKVKPEDELVPPVPSWVDEAERTGQEYVY